MKKRWWRIVLILLLILLIIVGLANAFIHYAIFETGIAAINNLGYSQILIDNIPGMPYLKTNFDFDPVLFYSRIALAIEWPLVVLILLILLLKRRRKEIKEELKPIKKINLSLKKYKKSETYTDIDILHEMLKERKIMGLLQIEKAFGVKKTVALEWCEILESGKLAEVTYPAFREPFIKINEKEIKNNEKTTEKQKPKKDK